MSEQAIRLTQYSHGAGCGCKISPKVLETILHSEQAKFVDPNLLVGNETSDDAAVYDLGNGTSIVSTTDFFMPIVDNPFDFGRIAATNAISDIFAMGGKPIMAIAILGWPINTLAPEIAREVVEGGRFACQQAGIALAGGHSIDAPEPIFGLAVTGVVPTERIKKNSTAQAGCKLYLTKPLGIGVLTTAEKKSLLKPEHQGLATETMCQMNLAQRRVCRHRRGEGDDRRHRLWPARPSQRGVPRGRRAGAAALCRYPKTAGGGGLYRRRRGAGRHRAQLCQLRPSHGRDADGVAGSAVRSADLRRSAAGGDPGGGGGSSGRRGGVRH